MNCSRQNASFHFIRQINTLFKNPKTPPYLTIGWLTSISQITCLMILNIIKNDDQGKSYLFFFFSFFFVCLLVNEEGKIIESPSHCYQKKKGRWPFKKHKENDLTLTKYQSILLHKGWQKYWVKLKDETHTHDFLRSGWGLHYFSPFPNIIHQSIIVHRLLLCRKNESFSPCLFPYPILDQT